MPLDMRRYPSERSRQFGPGDLPHYLTRTNTHARCYPRTYHISSPNCHRVGYYPVPFPVPLPSHGFKVGTGRFTRWLVPALPPLPLAEPCAPHSPACCHTPHSTLRPLGYWTVPLTPCTAVVDYYPYQCGELCPPRYPDPSIAPTHHAFPRAFQTGHYVAGFQFRARCRTERPATTLALPIPPRPRAPSPPPHTRCLSVPTHLPLVVRAGRSRSRSQDLVPGRPRFSGYNATTTHSTRAFLVVSPAIGRITFPPPDALALPARPHHTATPSTNRLLFVFSS